MLWFSKIRDNTMFQQIIQQKTKELFQQFLGKLCRKCGRAVSLKTDIYECEGECFCGHCAPENAKEIMAVR